MRTAFSVTTTPQLASPSDRNRTWLVLDNPSGATIYLDFTGDGSSPMSSSNSIRLIAGGQLYLDGTIATMPIFAMVATGTATLVIQGGDEGGTRG